MAPRTPETGSTDAHLDHRRQTTPLVLSAHYLKNERQRGLEYLRRMSPPALPSRQEIIDLGVTKGAVAAWKHVRRAELALGEWVATLWDDGRLGHYFVSDDEAFRALAQLQDINAP